MNTNELIQMADEAAERTGLDIIFHYGTRSGDKRLFLTANSPSGAFSNAYARDIESVKAFLAGLEPAPSKLVQLKQQRDQLQKEIDEMSNETLVCNKG